MVFTNATPSDLIEWFHHASDAKFMLCFLGGGRSDRQFWADILENAFQLDLISGQIADIIIFSDNLDELIRLPRTRGCEVPLVFGASVIASPRTAPISNREDFEKCTLVEMVRSNGKWFGEELNRLIDTSISMTRSLMDYFDVTADSLPCVVVVPRFCSPIVVPTEGGANAINLLGFIKKLGELQVPYFYGSPPKEPTDNTDRMAIDRTIKNILKLCNKISATAKEDCVTLYEDFAKIQEGLTSYLDGRSLPPEFGSHEIAQIGGALVGSPRLVNLGPRLQSALFGLSQHLRRREKYDLEVRALSDKMSRADDALRDLVKTESELILLCESFEKSLRWKSKWNSLLEFAKGTLCIASEAAKIADYKRKISTLVSNAKHSDADIK